MTEAFPVSFRPFEELSVYEQAAYARGLARASNSNQKLKLELPKVVKAYVSPLSAFKRLRLVRKELVAADMSATVILADERATGVGTAQLRGIPRESSPRSLKATDPYAQVVYWHGANNLATENSRAVALGVSILRHLTQVVVAKAEQDTVVWSVTLPQDEVKQQVYAEAGFEPVDGPYLYFLNDNVNVPRQLWKYDVLTPSL